MSQLKENLLFPGFETALNPESVCTILENGLNQQNSHLKVTHCKVADVKYDPKKQCSILYNIEFHDTFFNRSWSENISARVLKNGETPNFNTEPFFFSPPEQIAFFLFPNDPMMSWLPDMISPQTTIEQLNRHWASKNLKARKMETSLLGYTPQMRATFQYDFELENRTSGERENVSWIGKTNYFKPPHLNHAKHYAIWKAAKGEISISKPIDFLMHPRVAFQEKMQGERLGSLIQNDDFEKYLKETARTIAHFHSLQVPLANARSIDSEIASLTRWSNVLMNIRKDLKRRVEKLYTRIAAELEKRIILSSPVHADFHPSNILVEGDKVHLIDLDEMAFGDPCTDIGRFLSSLRIPSLRTFGSFDGLLPQREQFIETYLQKMQVERRNIHVFESASLITSAGSAFRMQRPNWMEEVLLLIEESEKALEKGKQKGGIRIKKKPSKVTPEDRLLWCQDNTFMLSHLTPYFKKKWNLDLFDCAYSSSRKTSSGYRVIYKTTSWEQDTKIKKKILLFLPKKGRAKELFALLKKKKKIADPIAYVQELEAVVTDYQENLALSDLLAHLPETP